MSAPTTVPAPTSRASGVDDAAAAAIATLTAASGSKRPLDDSAHDHQHDHEHDRRVHPRLDGPGATAHGEGDAAAANSKLNVSANGRPSSAAILHRHALECIFAFLDLNELTFTLRASRDWMGAVASMRRLELGVEQPSAPLDIVAQSLMGRHVSVIGDESTRVQLSAAGLSVLADHMAHLRELGCDLVVPPLHQPLLFPAQLHTLNIAFSESTRLSAAQLDGAIAAISRLPLLEELTIELPTMNLLISFEPLATMPLLRRLTILPRDQIRLTDAQVDQLRAMPRLRQLDVCMSTVLLQRLLRQPHDLQWQDISLPYWLDDETAALLPRLPSLTTIHTNATCSRFEWLRGLPNLTDVSLSFDADGDGGRIDSLVAGLRHCANIEILELANSDDLTAAHLADLLPRLPRLRQLELANLSINSLAFLSQSPMTNQLSRLSLQFCRQLPPSDLRHVHTLRGLETLLMWRSFTAPLDEHCQSLYTPPSVVMPQLAEFEYVAP